MTTRHNRYGFPAGRKNPAAPTTLRICDAMGGRPPDAEQLSRRSVHRSLGVGGQVNMFYVYLLKSISNPEQRYIGQTDDLKKRLKDHNLGYSIHTAKYKPWELVNYFAFSSKQAALDFEKYLKSGSGYVFSKRHFWK